MLLRYLGKLKIQIFCRYSVDTKENVNKLYLGAMTIIPVYAYDCMLSAFVFYQNLVLVAEYHVTC